MAVAKQDKLDDVKTSTSSTAPERRSAGRRPAYRIAVRVNPRGLLHETTTRDDLAIRVMRISGRHNKRRVRARPWHGING